MERERRRSSKATAPREKLALRRKWIQAPTPIRTPNTWHHSPDLRPVNNPAIMVAVILDSAVGLHQGGQVRRRCFSEWRNRYWNICTRRMMSNCPRAGKCCWLQNQTKAQELAEGSPDHLGEPIDVADASTSNPAPAATRTPIGTKPESTSGAVVAAALRQRETVAPATGQDEHPNSTQPTSETVAERPAIERHGCAGRRAGRNCGAVIRRQERASVRLR